MTNNWEIRFLELQNHLEANWQYPTLQHNIRLYRWIARQRYKKKNGLLKSSEIEKLNSIDFIWYRHEWKWNMMFGQLAEYAKTNALEPGKETGTHLQSWYKEQKKAMNKGTLRQDRMDKINTIKFSGPPAQARWLPVYEKLRQWCAANPRKWPRYNRNDKQSEESKLCVFCQQMRKRYRNNGLSEFWYKKMDEINFNFRGSTDNWLKGYNNIKELLAKHNSVSVKVIGDNAYQWVLRHKRKLDKGTLTAERAALIKQLQLERFLVSWDTKFSMVKQWAEENGKLPGRAHHRVYNNWLNSQKAKFRKGNFSEEQIEKLKSIGFDPKYRGRKHQEKRWIEKFNQYKSFLEEHGKEPSYQSADENEKKLYVWVMAQRAVKAGNAWNRKPLSKERTDKLNSINFEWVGLGPPGSGILAWNEKFKEFKKYIQPDGSLVLPLKIDGKRNITYTWWAYQKSAFKKGELSAEQISKLKKAGDINLYITSRWTKWVNRMKEIAAFIEQNGRYPKGRNSKKEECLYQSLLVVRRAYRTGKLSGKQLQLIKELNMEM